MHFNQRSRDTGVCLFCQRHTRLTFHHLIPKKVHRRKHFKKHFSKAALQQGIYVCRLCHDGIHDLYDEMQLAKHYCSAEALAGDAALSLHFQWVSKQKV